MEAVFIKTKAMTARIIIYAFLTFGALSMAIPYVWMIITSIKPVEEIQTYPPSFYVHNPTFSAYRELFSTLPMWRYLFNSFFIASLVTLTNIFLCSLAG